MRSFLVVPAIGLIAALLNTPPAVSQDSDGWTDLLGHNLKDWTRLGDGKNPWRFSTDHTLTCGPATDAYAPDDEYADGTLKFEYRFKPTAAKTGYKANVTVRRGGSAGCKIALGDNAGTLYGSFQGGSDRVKEVELKPATALARTPGEWNLVKVQLKGQTVSVTINGKSAGSFDRCDSLRGLIVFEPQGSEIDFRHVHWKAEK
ncbi:MAG TPA: family 16 glycoside hydrolase [Gemmataceae bacterium]|jgi:hypothetical protein|nr:family 16 glycoside hydrolase [Gemmataceae bacterium]